LRFDNDFNKDNDQFEPINSFETLKPIIPKELMDYCNKFEKYGLRCLTLIKY